MSFFVWSNFLIATILISISPGAGAFAMMTSGAKYGAKNSIWLCLGLQIGYFIYVIPVAVGIGVVILNSKFLFETIRWFGVLYLLYLGLIQLFSKSKNFDFEKLSSEKISKSKMLGKGFLINALNPKAILFTIAVLPHFLDPEYLLWKQILIIGVTMLTVDIIVMTGYSLFSSQVFRVLKSEKLKQWIQRFFGGLFIFASIGLAVFKN